MLKLPAKRHKFNAQPTHAFGVRFDSRAEANYYGQLRYRELAGEIRNLRRQTHFTLMVPVLSGALENVNKGQILGLAPLAEWTADFDFEERQADGSWRYVVVDVKGYDVPSTKRARRHFELQHGVEVQVITKPKAKRPLRQKRTG